jgi:predicted nucleic acid-binding protein
MAVADTGPLCYLILIREIDLLETLFGGVAIPEAVLREVRHPRAPTAVQTWASAPPRWLTVHADPTEMPLLPPLDLGESAAIALALELGAELLLVDDRAGTAAARGQGLETVGTVGVLKLASERRLLDLAAAFASLRATNFYYPPALLEALMAADRQRRGTP